MSDREFRPLEGTRVIDLTSNMSGPLATMVLADQGADVVKVEPLAGDLIRTVGTGRGGMSAYFANLNRGKRSIAVDLSAEAGVDVVRRLASTADVFVQNFRPGVVERLGLGADVLMADNERLVYGSISGFGLDGPLATEPAYDHVVQALSGFAALQAGNGRARPGAPGRDRQGERLHLGPGHHRRLVAAGHHGTRDAHRRLDAGRGPGLPVARRDDEQHLRRRGRGAAAGEPQLPHDPDRRRPRRAGDADGQAVGRAGRGRAHRGGRRDRRRPPATPGPAWPAVPPSCAPSASGSASCPPTRWSSGCGGPTCPARPCGSLDELHLDAQIEASGILAVVDHPVMGVIRQPGPAPLIDGIRPEPGEPAPQVGAHTLEVLAEAELSPAEVDSLLAAGVVRAGD